MRKAVEDNNEFLVSHFAHRFKSVSSPFVTNYRRAVRLYFFAIVLRVFRINELSAVAKVSNCTTAGVGWKGG